MLVNAENTVEPRVVKTGQSIGDKWVVSEGLAPGDRVIVEGLWLDIMSMTTPYSRDEAMRTVYVCASALFPRHFGESGLLEQPTL